MKLRAIIALAAAIIGAVFFMPAAQAQAYPPTICPTLSVSTTHPLPGETITVSGVNFNANAQVHLVLHSKAYDLGTVSSDGQGSFSTPVKLPSGVLGRHVIVAVSGAPQIQDCPIAVVVHIHQPGGSNSGPGGHHGGNSFTGVDILLIVLAAAALLGAGVALNRGGKRRHGSDLG
jgi:hypothetical protein